MLREEPIESRDGESLEGVGEQRYYPFGETRLTTGSMFTDKLYTGQREMAGLGIYHYGARFYSPKLGRFLSADTIVPNASNPQDFNRYSYVRNNPVRYTDPTGHTVACEDGDVCERIPLRPAPPPPPCTTCGGGGGGRGGNDDDIDPNPNGVPAPTICYPGELVCQLAAGGYEPVSNDDLWENLANLILPPLDSGSKTELYGYFSLIAGGQWGWTLITTQDGDLQLYWEEGITTGLGTGINLTRGIVGGLETAGEYEGGAVSVAAGGTGFVQAWTADNRGTGGLDVGGSFGVSIIPMTVAHTVADPIAGWSTELNGPWLFVCRLGGQCGR